MRVGLVVPRFGAQLTGGAEATIRAYGLALTDRGHDVRVYTTCASSHYTWANDLPAGVGNDAGMPVERFEVDPVASPLDRDRVGTVVAAGVDPGRAGAEVWLRASGSSSALMQALERDSQTIDTFLFAPYLFATTVFGARVVPERSLIMPCLHDEPQARFEPVATALHSVRGLLFNTEAERDLVQALHGPMRHAVVGPGIDLPGDAELASWRSDSCRQLCYAGRRESGKGFGDLLDWYDDYRRLSHDPLPLVLLGSGPKTPLPDGCDDRGFVSHEQMLECFAQSTAVVSMSRMESFSLLLMEAWSCSTPTIVRSDSTVMRDQTERSGGGLWCGSSGEFALAIDRLARDRELSEALGASGRRFAREHTWDVIGDRLVAAIGDLMA